MQMMTLGSRRRSLQCCDYALNPTISIEVYAERLTSENAMQLIQGHDIVLDGTDNIPTRYLVNDVCEILGIPWVYGSIYRFEGAVLCSI